MSDLAEVAKKAYSALTDDVSVESLGKEWDSDELKGLVQFDVLRMVAVFYLFSDEEKRDEIIENIRDIFDFDEPQRVLGIVINSIEAKSFISELYRKLPFSVGLMFEADQKQLNSNKSFMYAELIQVLVLAICCPNDEFAVNAQAYIYSAYVEAMKNHLLASDIEESNILSISLPGFSTISSMYEAELLEYEEIEECDNGRKIFDLLKNALEGKTIDDLVKRSEDTGIDVTYPKKRYLKIAEQMQGIEMDIKISDYIRSHLRIRFSGDTATFGFSDDADNEYEDEDEEEDDYTLYGEKIDVDELWEYLYENEDKVNDKFGEDCTLIIRNIDSHEDKKFKTGSMLYCLEMAREYKSELNEHDWWLIQYGEKDWETTSAFCSFADGIKKIWSMVKQIPDPLDTSIIPKEYSNFAETEVDDGNFEDLWNALKSIEAKYRKGINYDNRYFITDWESELCYEQGKLLENVTWTGKKIGIVPETAIPYCTYSKMEYEQLRYYLYWRTCFRNGEIIVTGYRTFYYLCAYELLVDYGPFTPTQRLKQLERLYKNFKYEGLTNAQWVAEYANVHGLEIQDDVVRGWATWNTNRSYSDAEILDVINGKYDSAFDIMSRKSAWKLKNNSFMKKVDCIQNIKDVITSMLPKMDKLFRDNGIVLSDYIVGKMVKAKYSSVPYSGSIWNACVIEKLGIGNSESEGYTMDYPSGKIYLTDAEGNIKRRTNTCMHYCDPYLSEYIIKYTEMLFRKELGYDYITMPEKLKGALKVKFAEGYDYVLSADKKLQSEEKKYISLYDDISRIIEDTTKEYFVTNADIIDGLRNQFSAVYQPPKVYPTEKKIPADELMIEFINSSDDSNGLVEQLIELYNQASTTLKKTKAKRFSNWIWDFWILHNNAISYYDLENTVVNNKWNLSAKRAVVERDYRAALPYFSSIYDLTKGVVSKKIDKAIIEDCVIVAFTVLDKLFSTNDVDSAEVLLGKWGEYEWDIYSTEELITNNSKKSIVKNISDLEIYFYDANKSDARVRRYEYGEKPEKFITYILKKMDNQMRALIGYKSMVSVEPDISDLYDIDGYEIACLDVDEVISEVVKFVVGHNNALSENAKEYEIGVTENSERDYCFEAEDKGISNIIEYVQAIAQGYYGLAADYVVEEVLPYDMVEIDFNHFNIEDYFEKYPADKPTMHHTFADINMYRFYDIYDEVLDRLNDVSNNLPVDYNSRFDFITSKVMNPIKGLTGKDLGALSTLVNESDDFGQWLAWIENGRIIMPKNLPYVQILFHFAMNRLIFEDEPEKCLVVLCEVWNYYFDSPEKMDQSSDLFLEWIKDYWMVYCPDMEYDDLKKLLRFNVIFDNENNKKYAKDHYLVDISTMNPNNLLSFYNANCDYHVLDGLVVGKGYRQEFEKAIEAVHDALAELWHSYGLSFEDYLHYEDKEIQDKQREIFFRGILTGRTKRYLRTVFEGREVSYTEDYLVGYDYDKNWPVLKYEQYEISNNSSRMLLDYIIKHTEKIMREHLGLNYNFKLDDRKMFELFPNKLFSDNLSNQIIVRTIVEATEKVCNQCGI